MGNFGSGVYITCGLWVGIGLLWWIGSRSGARGSKIAVGTVIAAIFITLVLVCLPKGQVPPQNDFYDALFIPRYAILTLLMLSASIGAVFCFLYVCLTPIQTRKIHTFGSVN